MKVAETAVEEKNSCGHDLLLNVPISKTLLTSASISKWPFEGI